jgi:predicted dehydrogenase
MADMRVAVVGAGILGRRHARVFHEMEGAALVAVASRGRERAESLASSYGVPVFTDMARLLDQVDCDAVAVATPDHLHYEPVMAALRAGRHVLVEKPLATDLHQARAMVDEAARRRLALQVNYSQRLVPEFAWIREQIRGGAIGRPVMIQSSKQDTRFVPTRMIAWAADTSPIFFMSSHDLDLVAWFLDGRAVHAMAREQRGVLEGMGVAAHDGIDALVAYDTGATASFHSSWIHPESWPHLVTERMTVIGETGMIHFEGHGRHVDCFARAGGRTVTFSGPQTATEVDGRIQGAFTASLEAFRRAVRDGEAPTTSAANTLHVTETQVAILEAAASGRPVSLAAAGMPDRPGPDGE